MILTHHHLRSAIHRGHRDSVIRLGLSLGLRASLLSQLGTEALVWRVIAACNGSLPVQVQPAA